MARKHRLIPLNITPGTMPSEDAAVLSSGGINGTGQVSVRCTDTDKVYFKTVDGRTYVHVLPGWEDSGITNIYGYPRSIGWYAVGGVEHLVLGSSFGLYVAKGDFLPSGTDFTNYTPLQASSTAAANSINTTISTSTVSITATSHGLTTGTQVRIKISGAADTGGITAATYINIEHVATVTDANTLTFTVGTTASSTVTGGGGAGTVYYKQLATGATDGAFTGFEKTPPRVWDADTLGDLLILTPGEGGKLYQWDGTAGTAPTAVSNAPTQVNGCFVMNNAVVTYGADGVANRIKISEIGDHESWTAGSGSTAWSDDVEGFGRIIGWAKGDGYALLFGYRAVLRLVYVGAPDLWDYDYILTDDGLVGPKAACVMRGVAYWMGNKDFYKYDGSVVQAIPNNTCRDTIYSYKGLNDWQCSFAHPVAEKSQVKWHFNEDSGGQPQNYVIHDIDEGHWTLGTSQITAALNSENPGPYSYYYLAKGTGSTAAAKFYTGGDNVGSNDIYPGDTNVISYFVTNYMTLDDNRRAEIVEFYVDIEPASDSYRRLTTYTRDMPFDPDTTTWGPITLSDAPNFPDATGKYWAFKLAIDPSKNSSGASANKFYKNLRVGQITQGVQPGVPL